MELTKLLFISVGIIFYTNIASYAFDNYENNNYIIAIDVGHSVSRVGALSARGRGEYYFNIDIAKLVLEKLRNSGFTKSFLVEENGNRITLRQRSQIANSKMADLLISIHHDSVQPKYLREWLYKGENRYYSDEFNGYSIFYSENNYYSIESLLFAKMLGEELIKNKFHPTLHHAEKIKGETKKLTVKNLGIYSSNELTILNTAKMPSVLLECGIILNRQEENEMRSREFIEKMSNIVLRATMNFFDHKTSTLRWSIPLISLKLNTNNPDFIGYTIPEVPRTTGTLTSSP